MPIVDTKLQESTEKLRRFLGRAHLIYLGVLPALATFAITAQYGSPWMFLIFLGGIAAVGVYLAAAISYTRLPEELPLAIFMLADGPLAVWLAQGSDTNPFAFAIEGYLVDGTTVWLGILFLAMRSPLPTSGQRAGSIGFMLLALGTTTALFWPYIQSELLVDWRAAVPLLVGLVEGTLLQVRLLSKDEVVRSGDRTILYIAGLLMLWVLLLMAGGVIEDAGWQLPGLN